MIRIGYIRASTREQKLTLEVQRKQLLDYGVPEENIYVDAAVSSKVNAESPNMQAVFKLVEESDEEIEIVVTKLDRWGGTLLRSSKGSYASVTRVHRSPPSGMV